MDSLAVVTQIIRDVDGHPYSKSREEPDLRFPASEPSALIKALFFDIREASDLGIVKTEDQTQLIWRNHSRWCSLIRVKNGSVTRPSYSKLDQQRYVMLALIATCDLTVDE